MGCACDAPRENVRTLRFPSYSLPTPPPSSLQVNANSNLRAVIGEAFGSGDPFERVVDFLVAQLASARAARVLEE